MFRNQLFAAVATCNLVVFASPPSLSAQQTTADNTGQWPVMKMSFSTTASADWITMGIGGRYAFLSSGDVVDVKTKKLVGQMRDEYGKPMHSEKLLEMSFSNGKLLRTVSQFGEGISSAVQARLAGRTTAANLK